MSFTWLFAIIVGGFILFLAIYAVITIKPSQQLEQDVKLGKEIGNILNLLETGFESIKADRKSTRLNSSHIPLSRMPSSA